MQLKLHTPPMSLNSYSKYSKRGETFLRTYHYRLYFETLRILSNTWLRRLSKFSKTSKIFGIYRVFQDFWDLIALLKLLRFKIYQELLRNWDLNNLRLYIESFLSCLLFYSRSNSQYLYPNSLPFLYWDHRRKKKNIIVIDAGFSTG